MKRPNILLAISDDQSWQHAGAYGCRFVNTPAFDRVAREGVLMNHAHCPAPQCAPSRASLLTGRNIWQNDEAGTHCSLFPKKLRVYPDLLEDVGYKVGYTGKPWGPGNWQSPGWPRNPAGDDYNRHTCEPPATGISNHDYAANFEDFLNESDGAQPFCFWFGCKEPHRVYEEGSGLRAGKRLEDVDVPPFLPDNDVVRGDLLDYAFEIDWFDVHLGRMLRSLESRGLLDDTLVVVTADNGMPFPRAKANNYEHGAHVPMAVRWGARVPGDRVVDDFFSFVDLAPTFLEAAGVPVPDEMSGRSLLPTLTSEGQGLVDETRTFTLTGRERHTHARFDNRGYPVRAIHTAEHVYVRNFAPDLWPAGEQFHDVDASPSKQFIIDHKDDETTAPYFEKAFAKRPLEELFDRSKDPCCLKNVADDPTYADVKQQLWKRLEAILKKQEDPRVLGFGDIFDAYPRVSATRPELGGFAESGKYNQEFAAKAREAMEKLGYEESEIATMCDKPNDFFPGRHP